MSDEYVDFNARADGTMWDTLSGKHAGTDPEWLNTERGLVNFVLDALSNMTEQFGICGDNSFMPSANPDDEANKIRVTGGGCLISPGLAVRADDTTDVTVTIPDVSKYVVLRRSYETYNYRAKPDGTNNTKSLRIHYPSIFLASSLEAGDVQLGTIADVDVEGNVTLSTGGRTYFVPYVAEEGLDTDRIGIDSIDDTQDLDGDLVTSQEQFNNQIASAINYLFGKGTQYSGNWNDMESPLAPENPTNVTVITDTDRDFRYSGVTVLSYNANVRAYAKVSWEGPETGPDPSYYQVKLVPQLLGMGGDSPVEQGFLAGDTKNHNNMTVGATVIQKAESYTFYNLPPNVKYKPYVRSYIDYIVNPQESDWTAGEAFISGGETGPDNPGNGVLSIDAGARSFDLSWTSIAGATSYAIYAKRGSQPDITNKKYLVEGSPFDDVERTVEWAESTTDTIYFRVVPISASGLQASWSMDNSATLNTAIDSPTSSDQVSAISNETSVLASVQALFDEENVDTLIKALKSFSRATDSLIRIINAKGITPSNAVSTTKDDSWLCPGDYRFKRVVAITTETDETFNNDTQVKVYVNGVENTDIRLDCADGYSSAHITDTNFGTVALEAGDIIYCQAASSSTAHNINYYVEIVPYYPV